MTAPKIAYITPDIIYNGNFTFMHDLLANMPVHEPTWNHDIWIIQPQWVPSLVYKLRDRRVSAEGFYPEFQKSQDSYRARLAEELNRYDVVISAHIANLDDVIPETVKTPIVSVSLAQNGYKTASGSYGNMYKQRFNKVAISETAKQSFPEEVRDQVKVINTGIDGPRLTQKISRTEVRNNWFPGEADKVKILLFTGAHQETKRLDKAVETLSHLPDNWHLLILSQPVKVSVPEKLRRRVRFCTPTYDVADIYSAVDCYILPTEEEGLPVTLLEAWFLGIPTVTTKHETMVELQGKHPDVDFGKVVDTAASPQNLAQAVRKSKKSPSAQECVQKNYMASNMVDNWLEYLEKGIPRE